MGENPHKIAKKYIYSCICNVKLQCKKQGNHRKPDSLSGTQVSQINSPRQFPAFCECAPFFTSLILFPSSAKKPGTVSQLLFVEKWLILRHTFSFHFPFELNCSVHEAKSKQGTHKLLQSSSPFITGIEHIANLISKAGIPVYS